MSRHGENKEVGWLRQQLAQMTAERDRLKQHLQAREELDAILMAEALPQAADGTGPISRVQGHRAPGRGPLRDRSHLRVVKVFAWIALLSGLGLKGRAARVAARVALAALVTGPTVTVAAGSQHLNPFHTSPASQAALPGWGTSASPVPSDGPSIVAFTTRSRPRLESRSAGAVQPAPYLYDPPVPSSPQQQAASQPSQAQAQSGPATLNVPVVGVDLTSGLPQTITLSAAGSGWTSWRVTATGSDLDFSPASGVLQGGQSVTLTVSLDASQDGATSEVFSIGGQSITATLPAPVPVPQPTDTPATDAAVPTPASS